MPLHVVILGAGFGGLELSTRLSEEVAGDVRVTLIDKSDSFVFGFAKLDVLFGRRSLDEVRHPYRDVVKPAVEFRQETVVSIDPESRRVVTDGGAYDADILVVALGADYDIAATPGLVEGGHEFYSEEGAERAAQAVARFDSGTAIVGVLGPLFKCPPAPFETAFLLNDALASRGVRDATSIYIITPLPKAIPVSDEVSGAIASLLGERGIEFWPSSKVIRLDPEAKVARLEDGRELAYDLFLAVPVHRAPAVVVESGLAVNGWIPVDVKTFATPFPDVFAVGDVTSAPVPRAGVIAEGEAATLADVLIARVRGGGEVPPYAGAAVCYMEMGDEVVGGVRVNFLSGPSPTAVFSPPSPEMAAEKKEWGASRSRRWFGHDVA
ncbi:MAG: NAD(P)/FAD-dependent oxidoreductase [Acidimicrobiales bacterium]